MAAPRTLVQAIRANPGAKRLGVYDGRTRLGTILELKSGKALACNSSDHLVGLYTSRKEASAAIKPESA